MSTSQTVLQGQDTVIQAGLYMSFELGGKKWMLTLSDGRRGPSRYSVDAGDTVAGGTLLTPRPRIWGCMSHVTHRDVVIKNGLTNESS